MKRISVILIQLAFVGSIVRADVIYSNLGPGDSFDTVAYLVLGPTSNLGVDIDIAAPFMGSAQPTVLASAEMALGHSPLSGNNELLVQLRSDVGGSPGSVLASSSVAQVPAGPTLVTADFSASPVTLQPGNTYWLVADANDDAFLLWFWNNTGDFGVAERQSDIPGGGWNAFDGVSPAFRINGNVVPEPSGLILTSLALVGLLLQAGGTAYRCR